MLKNYVAVSFPQALVLLLSSQPSVHTKPLFVMLPGLQSYCLTFLAAMLPSVTTQLAKFAALFNALRIPWFSVHLSKPYCQELFNFLSLVELLDLLSSRTVQTYGDTHAHLTQGTRPFKKLTNIKDVKRYLNVATIASDGLLVVKLT